LLDKVDECKEIQRNVALARCADLNTLAESATRSAKMLRWCQGD
jgi:hypothetical protein